MGSEGKTWTWYQFQHPETVTCGYCKKEFTPRKTKARRRKPLKFCSQKCVNRVRWAGKTGFVNRWGYWMIRARDGKHVPEHRIIMRNIIGRELTKFETVHHINGDRLDNRPENLELWAKKHTPGQRVSDRISHARAVLEEYGLAFSPPSANDVMLGALSVGG